MAKLDDYVVELQRLENMAEVDSVRVFPVLFTWRAQVSFSVGHTLITTSEWHWRKRDAVMRVLEDALELATQLTEARV